jgi:conjugative relaxase-like TrwC/TraI family protein
MSIHKLAAGSGYDYLTRQVAAFDATARGHVGLASYYAERGESPGVWVGSGIVGIDGLQAGDEVTAEQMWALFGVGMHPLAAQRLQQLSDDELSDENIRTATRLGAPFKLRDVEPNRFHVEVARRFADHADSTKALASQRDIRAEVAREFFQAEHGRVPTDERELAAAITKLSRPPAQSVAGYDLTFSPVKSVSTLWAVADPQIAAVIERAHQAAVGDALRFIENDALYAREGPQGVRQVNVRGLVAAAFTHRDSRSGDPDLHTHVAVANKVQTLKGRWLSIDGRVLFKAVVAASETYNTALEHHLRDQLGVRFAERSDLDPRKLAVREIVGVDPELMVRWSARRQDIKTRSAELSVQFQHDHGRPPTPVEALRLAQQATLETRQAKHEPRSLTEQRATWHAHAAETLDGPEAVQAMISQVLHPTPAPSSPLDGGWVSRTAGLVLAATEERRSTWQRWHVRAEALRRVRAAEVPSKMVDRLVDDVVAEVLNLRSVSLARPEGASIAEPAALRRSDGSSVYTVAGSDLFTSARILAAEQRLVAHAGHTDGRRVDGAIVELALLEHAANGITLDAGQAALVRSMSMSGARLQLAIAPAGTGKTTALRALTRAWIDSGGAVLGLAPSAAAAAQLRESAGAPTDTLAKLTWSIDHGDLPDWAQDVGRSTLVIIDEAGMADTLSLDTAVDFIVRCGGSVRLIGDDQQLAAIGAGGVLRDIQTVHGADRLTELHRFIDPAEAAATLALRDGRPEALGFYLDRQRIHVGDPATTTDQLFAAWQADRDRGLETIMLAPTRDLVSQLNQRARTYRLNKTLPGREEVQLADGNRASAGDVIITRQNDRRIRISSTDWVKNGDRWTVLDVTETGALKVRHAWSGRIVTLPPGYVGTATQLGYATTVHTAQGVTVETMHGLAIGAESRQLLYTMLSRGSTANHLYIPVVGDGDPHAILRPENIRASTATELLEQILAHDATAASATTLHGEQRDPAIQLGHSTARYLDALHVAAEHVAGPRLIADLDREADQLINGLTREAAWPALRGRLLLTADDTDPVAALRDAAQLRELDTAADHVAVLAWRLDDTYLHSPVAPMPWLPGIPARIASDPDWGPYLAARARLIIDLADQVRTTGQAAAPSWAVERRFLPSADLIADIQVWRAAMQVQPADLRPTGPIQSSLLARTWQHRLDKQLVAADIAQDQQWTNLVVRRIPNVTKDSFLPSLVDRLGRLDRAGFDATGLVRSAAAKGPLPDDHPAAALWWRILDELPQRPPNNSEQPTPALARPGASRFSREPYRPTQGPRTPGPPPPR